ncbi:hypothetical protein Zmor_022554 [Zophobas morio]|uniref:Uncharacterized protein n=1 Tax=Zophobas morio TaxID=2755281 RepID=A0AA38HVT9_9CUCU|nr:hypothetical protein Zmor_022554 [Zophobas morio]
MSTRTMNLRNGAKKKESMVLENIVLAYFGVKPKGMKSPTPQSIFYVHTEENIDIVKLEFRLKKNSAGQEYTEKNFARNEVKIFYTLFVFS